MKSDTKSLTPRTDNFDRIEYPKGTYPLKGPEWVPIEDCRDLENELFLSRGAHDIAERELTAAIAERDALRDALADLAGWANLKHDDPRWNNLGGRVAAALKAAK